MSKYGIYHIVEYVRWYITGVVIKAQTTVYCVVFCVVLKPSHTDMTYCSTNFQTVLKQDRLWSSRIVFSVSKIVLRATKLRESFRRSALSIASDERIIRYLSGGFCAVCLASLQWRRQHLQFGRRASAHWPIELASLAAFALISRALSSQNSISQSHQGRLSLFRAGQLAPSKKGGEISCVFLCFCLHMLHTNRLNTQGEQ